VRLVAVLSLLAILACPSPAQVVPTSDPQALSLAAQSIAAMTGKTAVSDITLNATVTSIAGSDNFTGTAVLQAKGTAESRIDLNLNGTARSEIRAAVGGIPNGAWQKANAAEITSAAMQPYALHNCWTDAAWFFPVLTSLGQTSNQNFIFSYIGSEQHAGFNVQHIRVYQVIPQDTKGRMQTRRLSTMDFYLDPASSLPMAAAFTAHPDDDMNTDVLMEIRVADYRVVNGIQVPFHVQRLLNGGLSLDVVVTNVVFNSGLSDSAFNVQ